MATDESYDSLDEHYDRPAERWAPLGAANTTPPLSGAEYDGYGDDQAGQLKQLEEEQEQLNSSLLALTTHFAQVQFRLKQIVSADQEEKEILLKELEEFAFKGIPDVRGCKVQDAQMLHEASEKEHDQKIQEQRRKQQELITQLKDQLDDLENYAFETGDIELPTSKTLEKQKVIIDELRTKLDLDLDHFNKLSTEELKMVVDKAIGQIVNPAKVKEKLVDQLKTQIVDLERFIEFLQGESQGSGAPGQCSCPVHGKTVGTRKPTHNRSKDNIENEKRDSKRVRDTTLSIMKQALTVLQIFAVSQFGCGGREFQKNLLKRTTKGNHWGDLRARLEVAIENVARLALVKESETIESDYTSDSEDAPVFQCNQELVTAVRKELSMALRDLLQHGLMEVGQSTSLVPFGCFPSRSARQPAKMMHAWDLFIKYYEMKHGAEYTQSPARKLSQSFDLDIVGGKPVTAKQTLLSAIDQVLATHGPLKRSEDSQLKAFVCLALNEKRLVQWLRLVLRTSSLVEFYYQPWSYVMKTGFDDALQSLDKLAKLNMNLPVDLAVRPFNNIRDAF